MRPRWQEWVIALSLVVLGMTGFWTLWGDDIVRLFRPEQAQVAPVSTEGAAKPPPPAGPAKGPF